MKLRTGVVALGVVVLAGLLAGQIVDRIAGGRIAAGLDRGKALLPSGVGMTYGGVSYSVLTGVATITGLTFTSGAGGVTGTETIARVDVAGVPWDLGDRIAQVQAAPQSLTRDTVIPIATGVSLTGIRSQTPNLRLSLASMTITGLRVRPWALFRPGIPSLAEIVHQITTPPPDLEGPDAGAVALAQATPLLRFAAAMVLAIEYDGVAETGLVQDLTPTATADASAQPRHFSLLRANQPGGLHHAVFAPVDEAEFREDLGDNAGLTIARLESAGFDFRTPAERLVAGAPLTRDLVDGLGVGDITLSGIAVRTPAYGLVTVTRIGFDGIGFDHGVLAAAHAGVEQLHLTAAALGQTPAAAAALQSLDLHALTISAGAGYHWDIGNQAVTLDRTEVRIDELGDLAVDGRVEGVSPTMDLASLRDHAVVREGHIRYRDASLARRLIAASAARAQTDPAAMREHLIEAIQQRGANLGAGPVITNLVGALTDFIQAPTSLSVTIKPSVPLPLSDLLMQQDQDPQVLLDRLGVTAVANQ